MINCLVTIAIPIYNSEDHLYHAIRSVLNQTFKNFELFLINDGSTDKSLQIMHSFIDERISIVDDGINKGLIERLNQSISLANGKYYARMDADDIMFITRIEEQVLFLESHPEIDVLGSSIMTIDNNNNIIGSGLSKGRVHGFVHPTVMGKTEWFKANPYSAWAVRAEDTELWLRTYDNSVFWALEKPLMFYREYGVPTRKKYLASQKTMCKIFTHYNEYNKSFVWFLKKIIVVFLKSLLCIIFSLFDSMDYFVKLRRRIPLDDSNMLSKDDLFLSIR